MKFARIAAVCSIGIALAVVFASCAETVTQPDTTAETTAKQSENTTDTEAVMTETETETEAETEEIKPEVKTITVCAPSDKTCRFTVVYDMNGENPPIHKNRYERYVRLVNEAIERRKHRYD